MAFWRRLQDLEKIFEEHPIQSMDTKMLTLDGFEKLENFSVKKARNARGK